MIEIIATIILLVSIFLLIKKNIYCWYLNIFGTAIWLGLFWSRGLFILSTLQISIILISIYSIKRWSIEKLEGKVLKFYDQIGIKIALVSLFVITSQIIFVIYVNNSVNFIEIAGVLISVMSNYLAAKKNKYFWILQIMGNILFATLAITEGMVVTGFTYLVFVILSISGFIEWNKKQIIFASKNNS